MADVAPKRARLIEASVSANDGTFTPSDWGLFLAVSAIWGSSFLLIDIGLDAMGPGLVTWGRVAMGALALLPFRAVRAPVDPADRFRVFLLSVVWVAVPFTLFPLAEVRISSAVAGMLNGGMPIFAAIVAGVLLRQRLAPVQTAGLVVGLAGVVVISLAQGRGDENAWSGIAMVIAATVCYGYAVTLAAPLQQRYGSVGVMGKMLALAAVWTAPYGLWSIPGASFEPGPFLAVGVLGAVGTGLAFVIMGSLVGRVGSTRASFITYLVPVVAMILGVTLRDDVVEAAAVVGVALVITGAVLASRSKRTVLLGDAGPVAR